MPKREWHFVGGDWRELPDMPCGLVLFIIAVCFLLAYLAVKFY
jgi:hypothetical protein